VDQIVDHYPDACGACGRAFTDRQQRPKRPRHWPCFRFPACISQSESPPLSCAERAHASTRVLAAFQLTIDPKRNSAALGRGFWFVANPAIRSALLLRQA
jgi:hypothetical protein